MRNNIKKIFCLALLTLFLLSTTSIASQQNKSSEITDENKQIEIPDFLNRIVAQSTVEADLDPLVDLEVSVIIKEIRGFDKIDILSEPDFYVKVLFEDGKEFKSPVWKNQNHVEEEWIATQDVDDANEWVNITIQLWDKDITGDKLCDISVNNNYGLVQRDISVMYNLKTGHWYSFGDDMITPPGSWLFDYSGYGRANGCDDNSIYENDLDCELYFDIVQNDFDGDGIPYWTETEIFGTDPELDDLGRDDDCDGIPIEWEFKWGHRLHYRFRNDTLEYEFAWEYDPFEYNDHKALDPDEDSISNYEEYLTWELGSDPFRKDIFVELDQMREGPNGQPASILTKESQEYMYKAFNRQNIVLYIDDGSAWENSGSDMIPFDEITNDDELDSIYEEYFVNDSNYSWKRGIFHYGVVIYQSSVVNGNAFGSNRYQISAKGLIEKAKLPVPLTGNKDLVFATAYMHELGHSLGLMWLGGHTTDAYYPWQPLWWKFRPYKSIMNYGYMFGSIYTTFCDYSDGSRGKNDFDDWNNIDFDYFEQ